MSIKKFNGLAEFLYRYDNINFNDLNTWGKAFIGAAIWEKYWTQSEPEMDSYSLGGPTLKWWVKGLGLNGKDNPAGRDMKTASFEEMAKQINEMTNSPKDADLKVKGMNMILSRLAKVYNDLDYFYDSDPESEDVFVGTDAESEDESQTPSPLKQTSMTPKKQKTPSPPKKKTPSPKKQKTPSPPKKVVVEDDYFTNSEDDSEDSEDSDVDIRRGTYHQPSESDDEFTNSEDDEEETPSPQKVKTPSPQKVKTPSPQKVKTPSPKKKSAIKQRALLKIQNYLASDIPTRSVTFAEEKEAEKKRREERQNRPKKMPKGTPKPSKKLIEKVTIL